LIAGLIRLLALGILILVGMAIARSLGGVLRRKAARPPAGGSEGAMVRDRVCNTFLPRSSAIQLQVGQETFYFCSESCRRRFLDDSRAAETA
jgi:YHS domain-containing protein